MMDKYAHMEMDDDDSLDNAISLPGGEKDTPRYPWGLRICLTDAEMAKLGMEGEPAQGDILHFSAFAEVTSFSRTNDASGTSRRLEMTITHILSMEDETTETPGRG
jgi:hypothetical protein